MTRGPKSDQAVTVGGPRDGWGYWQQDLVNEQEATEATGNTMHYRPTRETRNGPQGQTVRVWRWDGTVFETVPSRFEPDQAYWHSQDSAAHE